MNHVVQIDHTLSMNIHQRITLEPDGKEVDNQFQYVGFTVYHYFNGNQ